MTAAPTMVERVLECCSQPRTRIDVETLVGPTARSTMFNLRKSGHLVNLLDGSRRQPGLYVRAELAAEWRARLAAGDVSAPQRREPYAELPRPPAPGGDLAAAWGIGGRR